MDTIINALKAQITLEKILKICFFDIDGTLFTAGWRIVTAPIYNSQTMALLKKYSIPCILVTGRQTWNSLIEKEMPLHGIKSIDGVIAGAGTEIFYRNKHGKMQKDLAWRTSLLQTQVTWNLPNGKPFMQYWDKQQITDFLKDYRVSHKLTLKITQGNALLVRILIEEMNKKELFEIITALKKIWIKGIKIEISEKLLRKNTKTIFTGDMLIMPEKAGKDNAITYILKNIAKNIDIHENEANVYLFGDAMVDIPMLSMKSPKTFLLHSYLVHPTPLAREEATKYSQINIREQEGPQAILSIITSDLNNIYSAEQNSPIRKFEHIVEPLLNNILDKNLSANDISFLGLKKLQEAFLIAQESGMLHKLQAIYLYLFSMFTDVLDGVRARYKGKMPEGQLVDGFCDRAKEFYQLYLRATKRNNNGETFLAALSCCLPSISRAQAELQNIVVPEKDVKGGSMINRTKLLTGSFLYSISGQDKQSYAVDKEIYLKNMATFNNRLAFIHKHPGDSSPIWLPKHKDKMTELQIKALERFLLYVQILQEEYRMINKSINNNIHLKEFKEIIKPYENLEIKKLREIYKIKDYHLYIRNYIKNFR